MTGVAYPFASAQECQKVCYKDLNDSQTAWCADVVSQDDLPTTVFEEYHKVGDWVPSGNLSTRTFERVKDGSPFVYETSTKYFSRNPFGFLTKWFS